MHEIIVRTAGKHSRMTRPGTHDSYRSFADSHDASSEAFNVPNSLRASHSSSMVVSLDPAQTIVSI